MIRKILSTLLLTTLSVMALEQGEILPQPLQTQLKLEKDKLYVIDFFASWCKSCKKELPLIATIHDNNLTEVIGINVDKNREEGEAFVKKFNLKFPIVYDSDQALINTFKPLGFPTLYYIKNGKILKSIVGAIDAIDLQIQKDLKEFK